MSARVLGYSLAAMEHEPPPPESTPKRTPRPRTKPAEPGAAKPPARKPSARKPPARKPRPNPAARAKPAEREADNASASPAGAPPALAAPAEPGELLPPEVPLAEPFESAEVVQHAPSLGHTITPAPKQGAEHKGAFGFLRELPVLIVIAFGLAMLIKTFLVQAFFIPSESMVPTLEVGDRVLVNKLVYRFREPRRGEVIVFIGEDQTPPNRSFPRKVIDFITEGFGLAPPSAKDFIKRVIALPGETITVRRGKVTITPVRGKRFTIKEPYLIDEKDLTPYGPFTVPPDEYFVMGDNRPNSADSRSVLGPIPKKEIVGRAFVRIWPVRRIGLFRRPGYGVAATASGTVVPLVFAGAFVRKRRRDGRRRRAGPGRRRAA